MQDLIDVKRRAYELFCLYRLWHFKNHTQYHSNGHYGECCAILDTERWRRVWYSQRVVERILALPFVAWKGNATHGDSNTPPLFPLDHV